MTASSTSRRSWLFLALRLAISIALVAWLVHRLEGGWSRLGTLHPVELWPAALLFAVSCVLGAWQWTLLLRHAGIQLPAGRLQQLYWIGLFFNNFLPTNVGGDLVKVADVALKTGTTARPVAATLLDRLLGLSGLVLLAIGAGALLGGDSPAGLPWWALVALTLPVIVVSAAILSRRVGRWTVVLVARITAGRRGSRLQHLVDEMAGYRLAPGFVLRILALAVVVQGMRVATHLLVARELGVRLDPPMVLELFVLVPVLGVAIVLPISFNGLGVREWIATRLMPAIGIGAETAFVLVLATYLVQVAVSLVGGALFTWQMARGRLGRHPS
jgi:uncharacterized membrane protein YbhN (UPF0104 family)